MFGDMATTISKTEAQIYITLRDAPERWFTTAELAEHLDVAVRTVQRGLSRLVGMFDLSTTRPPKCRIAPPRQRDRELGKRLDEAAHAYGLVERDGKAVA